MHAESKKLREQRQTHVEAMHALVATAEGESRDMNDEEREKFTRADTAQEQLKTRIDRIERTYALERESLEKAEVRQEKETGSTKGAESSEEVRQTASAEYRNAWQHYCRHGVDRMDSNQREVLERGFVHNETRQQGTAVDSAGGYLVPDEAMRAIEDAELAVGAMFSVVDVMTTDSGADLPMPTSNDTGNKGEIIAENAEHNTADIVFGQIVLQAYTYSSKIVKVSRQLLQDSATNMDVFVPMKLGERIGRIVNEHFTTGTGTGQPNGITNCPAGPTAGSATAVAYLDLTALEHSVDPAYRNRPGVRWMFHDTTLQDIKELVDGENRPLWLPSVRAGDPDRILGYEYVINQDMPEIEAAAKPIVFGDMTKYQARRVSGVQMLRLVERYAEFLQVGFLGFERWDGDILDAGTGPIKHLLMAASV